MSGLVQRLEQSGSKPEAPVVMIVSAGTRYFIRQLLESRMPNLYVISHNEVPPEMSVMSMGVI